MAVISALRRFLFGQASAMGTPVSDRDERNYHYGLWEALYRGDAYLKQVDGGYRELIIRDHIGIEPVEGLIPALTAHYNPIRPIVDLYQRVLPGRWGDEITLDLEHDGRPTNPDLIGERDPLGKIWRASRLDMQKNVLARRGALLGLCPIRVVAARGRQTYLQLDHPGILDDYEEDSRGNLTWVRLEYDERRGRGDDARDVRVVEEFDKESLYREADGAVELDEANALGVCPYVLWRFGGDGRPAHDGASEVMHRINWLLTEQGDSIYAHMWPQWLMAAGGRRPEEMPMGRSNGWYVQTGPDTPPPTVAAIVPKLDQAAATEFIEKRKQEQRATYPELTVGGVRELSGLSGEAYANLLKPASDKVIDARAGALDALTRALQVALSYEVVLNGLNLGTGSGTARAADEAYRAGKLDFHFADMPVMPESPYDRKVRAEADTHRRRLDLEDAGKARSLEIFPRRELGRIAGYTDAELDPLLKQAAEVDAADPPPM